MYQKKDARLCEKCGKPTNRHATAKYCFLCMTIVNAENNKMSHRKSNAKRKEKKNEG